MAKIFSIIKKMAKNVVRLFAIQGLLHQSASASKVCPVNNGLTSIENNSFSGINCSDYRLQASQLRRLEREFVIYGNAPLECAEFILFAEAHNDNIHLSLQKKYIPILSKKEDYLLLEGIQSLNVTECKKSDEANKSIEIGKDLTCLGWDSPGNGEQKILKIGQKYNRIFARRFSKNPYLFINNIKNLHEYLGKADSGLRLITEQQLEVVINEVKRIKDLKINKAEKEKGYYKIVENFFGYRLIHALKGVHTSEPISKIYYAMFGKKNVNSLWNKVEKVYEALSGDLNIINRNKSLIQTLNFLKCKENESTCHRKLLITGAAHLFETELGSFNIDKSTGKRSISYRGIENSEQKQNLFFSNMAQWKKTSPHAEVRDFLEETKHTILYPKQG